MNTNSKITSVAVIYYSDDTVNYVVNPDLYDIEMAETIIHGTSGNHTGRTPTQDEFKEAWKLMTS